MNDEIERHHYMYEIERHHDMYHDLATFTCEEHGGNFHWKIMVIMVAPGVLKLVEKECKVGRFMEAFCAWKGPQNPKASRS